MSDKEWMNGSMSDGCRLNASIVGPMQRCGVQMQEVRKTGEKID